MRCCSLIYDQLFRDGTHTSDLMNGSEIFFLVSFQFLLQALLTFITTTWRLFNLVKFYFYLSTLWSKKKNEFMCRFKFDFLNFAGALWNATDFTLFLSVSKCVTFADPIYSRATCIFDNIRLFYWRFQPIKNVAKNLFSRHSFLWRFGCYFYIWSKFY